MAVFGMMNFSWRASTEAIRRDRRYGRMLSSSCTNLGRLIFFYIPFTASNIEFLGPGPSRSLGRNLEFMPPMAPMVPNASIRGTSIWIKVLAVS